MSFNRIAVIDHHRRAATYISNATLNFHEPYASSASELVSELLSYLVEASDILQPEAEAVMAGIMLDTKNFALRTGGRTFDAAAFLRRAGADTSEVKRLMQSDFDSMVAKYAIIKQAERYMDGMTIAVAEGETDKVAAAQAADELLNIRGIEASFVVFVNGGDVNISARSIGNVNVQLILEKLGGGGNKATAGVQIKGVCADDAADMLKKEISDYMQSEKQAHKALDKKGRS
jgi:c-di-AMP phosphodiesterase-like protein